MSAEAQIRAVPTLSQAPEQNLNGFVILCLENACGYRPCVCWKALVLTVALLRDTTFKPFGKIG